MEQKFACVINCMDGRIQTAVIDYMREKYNTMYVDSVTVAGPSKILSEYKKDKIIKNIKFRADISVEIHGSKVIAIVGHFDCAMIKLEDDIHKAHVLNAVENVKKWHETADVIGLWVDNNLEVSKLT